MSLIKPRNFKGTRDFTPEEMIGREELIERIKRVFRLYGFSPLETPALEMLEILSGKYGDEGEKLLYKLDYKNDRPHDRVALRYDLTVPMARVVALNPQWPLPFKRYQVQPVWRADQPQIRQGRFREFYQCDVDTVGAEEGTADAEIIALTVDMLKELGFEGEGRHAVVLVNHRKILEALCTLSGRPETDMMPFCRALDKFDKIGADGVKTELDKIGVSDEGYNRLGAVFDLSGSTTEMLDKLDGILKDQPAAAEGIEGLRSLFGYLDALNVESSHLKFDPRLARGLDYYTGAVFETVLPDHPHIGSLTGGGRYDKLIGLYLGKDIPAVGTTIGLDRMYAAMKQLDMLKVDSSTVTRVLVAAWSSGELNAAMEVVSHFRNAGINSTVFPKTGKLKKPFSYADKMGIPVVAVLGPDEVAHPEGIHVSVKFLGASAQITMSLNRAVKAVHEYLESGKTPE